MGTESGFLSPSPSPSNGTEIGFEGMDPFGLFPLDQGSPPDRRLGFGTHRVMAQQRVWTNQDRIDEATMRIEV